MRIFSLTHEAVSQQGWALGEDRDGLQVEVPTGGGRTQVVYLEPGTDRDGDTIAWIWSKAADSEAIDDPWGLLTNNQMATGLQSYKVIRL